MRKYTVLMMVIVAFVFCSMGTAFGTKIEEIDLLYLFDTNNDGKIRFGDGFSGITLNKKSYDFFGNAVISQTFELTHKPISGSDFTVSFQASDVNNNSLLGSFFYNSFLNINGNDGVTSDRIDNGFNSFSGSSSSFNFGPNSINTIKFEIGSLWGLGINLDDFYINFLTLAYEYEDNYREPSGPEMVPAGPDMIPSPVPEPSTMVFFGVALLGAAGLGRRKK